MENTIKFEDIQKANKNIGTTNIQGKEYAEVNQRIKAFRMVYPTGTIYTDLLSNQNGVAIFKATISDEAGKVLGTGTAYEKEGNSFINKTSYIENCETSAVGRALGMCGFGIDTSLCSAEELQNAKLNQNKRPSEKTQKNDQKQESAKSATVGNTTVATPITEADKADILDYLSGAGVPYDYKTDDPEFRDKKLYYVGELIALGSNLSSMLVFYRCTTLNEMDVVTLERALKSKQAQLKEEQEKAK